MCNPAFIAVGISAATSVAGGFMQAQQYRMQAQGMERQAKSEEATGAYNSQRLADSNNRRLDEMRAGYLSSGIALEGAPNEVIQDSATQASLDEQAIRYDANVRADNQRFQARLARANAGNAILGGFLNAAGTVAGGYANWQDKQDQRTLLRNPYVGFAQ